MIQSLLVPNSIRIEDKQLSGWLHFENQIIIHEWTSDLVKVQT